MNLQTESQSALDKTIARAMSVKQSASNVLAALTDRNSQLRVAEAYRMAMGTLSIIKPDQYGKEVTAWLMARSRLLYDLQQQVQDCQTDDEIAKVANWMLDISEKILNQIRDEQALQVSVKQDV